jgi:hypothetical protein
MVGLMISISVAVSILTHLISIYVVKFSFSSLVTWGMVGPALATVTYGRKYKKGMSKDLRNKTALLYFICLIPLGLLTVAAQLGADSHYSTMEWNGLIIVSAAAITIEAYVIFWVFSIRYDDP